jgi:formylmethanofuran dehydrogenase subunit D
VKFVDYYFSLSEDGSIGLDPELTIEKLNLKEGDLFKVEVIDGVITFKKQSPRQIWEGN